ncbi:MAG: hypothetical protein DHS80DRAFT_32824 [Piptocephalis tieghemiana]|nr:MAG: hypothetical protein DHS80DRAFT_32824 [Piptocephalis tieghemiana]
MDDSNDTFSPDGTFDSLVLLDDQLSESPSPTFDHPTKAPPMHPTSEAHVRTGLSLKTIGHVQGTPTAHPSKSPESHPEDVCTKSCIFIVSAISLASLLLLALLIVMFIRLRREGKRRAQQRKEGEAEGKAVQLQWKLQGGMEQIREIGGPGGMRNAIFVPKTVHHGPNRLSTYLTNMGQKV